MPPQPLANHMLPIAVGVVPTVSRIAEAAKAGAAADGLMQLLGASGSESDASSDTEATAEANMQPTDALARLASCSALM
eukprot:5156169-Prymnesium_polylepis.1